MSGAEIPVGGWAADTADWWQREFTDGVDPEYTEQILPIIGEQLSGASRILDVGTGEGQVARMLSDQGANVYGIDPIAEMVTEARSRSAAVPVSQAEASALPFAAGNVRPEAARAFQEPVGQGFGK